MGKLWVFTIVVVGVFDLIDATHRPDPDHPVTGFTVNYQNGNGQRCLTSWYDIPTRSMNPWNVHHQCQVTWTRSNPQSNQIFRRNGGIGSVLTPSFQNDISNFERNNGNFNLGTNFKFNEPKKEWPSNGQSGLLGLGTIGKNRMDAATPWQRLEEKGKNSYSTPGTVMPPNPNFPDLLSSLKPKIKGTLLGSTVDVDNQNYVTLADEMHNTENKALWDPSRVFSGDRYTVKGGTVERVKKKKVTPGTSSRAISTKQKEQIRKKRSPQKNKINDGVPISESDSKPKVKKLTSKLPTKTTPPLKVEDKRRQEQKTSLKTGLSPNKQDEYGFKGLEERTDHARKRSPKDAIKSKWQPRNSTRSMGGHDSRLNPGRDEKSILNQKNPKRSLSGKNRMWGPLKQKRRYVNTVGTLEGRKSRRIPLEGTSKRTEWPITSTNTSKSSSRDYNPEKWQSGNTRWPLSQEGFDSRFNPPVDWKPTWNQKNPIWTPTGVNYYRTTSPSNFTLQSNPKDDVQKKWQQENARWPDQGVPNSELNPFVNGKQSWNQEKPIWFPNGGYDNKQASTIEGKKQKQPNSNSYGRENPLEGMPNWTQRPMKWPAMQTNHGSKIYPIDYVQKIWQPESYGWPSQGGLHSGSNAHFDQKPSWDQGTPQWPPIGGNYNRPAPPSNLKVNAPNEWQSESIGRPSQGGLDSGSNAQFDKKPSWDQGTPQWPPIVGNVNRPTSPINPTADPPNQWLPKHLKLPSQGGLDSGSNAQFDKKPSWDQGTPQWPPVGGNVNRPASTINPTADPPNQWLPKHLKLPSLGGLDSGFNPRVDQKSSWNQGKDIWSPHMSNKTTSPSNPKVDARQELLLKPPKWPSQGGQVRKGQNPLIDMNSSWNQETPKRSPQIGNYNRTASPIIPKVDGQQELHLKPPKWPSQGGQVRKGQDPLIDMNSSWNQETPKRSPQIGNYNRTASASNPKVDARQELLLKPPKWPYSGDLGSELNPDADWKPSWNKEKSPWDNTVENNNKYSLPDWGIKQKRNPNDVTMKLEPKTTGQPRQGSPSSELNIAAELEPKLNHNNPLWGPKVESNNKYTLPDLGKKKKRKIDNLSTGGKKSFNKDKPHQIPVKMSTSKDQFTVSSGPTQQSDQLMKQWQTNDGSKRNPNDAVNMKQRIKKGGADSNFNFNAPGWHQEESNSKGNSPEEGKKRKKLTNWFAQEEVPHKVDKSKQMHAQIPTSINQSDQMNVQTPTGIGQFMQMHGLIPAGIGHSSQMHAQLPTNISQSKQRQAQIPTGISPLKQMHEQIPSSTGQSKQMQAQLPTGIGSLKQTQGQLPTGIGPLKQKQAHVPTSIKPSKQTQTQLPNGISQSTWAPIPTIPNLAPKQYDIDDFPSILDAMEKSLATKNKIKA